MSANITPIRQSASLRISQLTTNPATLAQLPSMAASPTMENIEAAENFGMVTDLVASKDNLLIRCKDTIEELHKEVDKEKKNKEILNQSLMEVNTELEESKRKMIDKDEKIENLEKSCAQLSEELEAANSKNSELSQKVKELKYLEQSSQNEVEYKSAVMANTEQERKELRKNNDELLEMVDERDKQIKDLIHIIEDLEGKLGEKEESHRDVIASLGMANSHLVSKKEEVDNLYSKIDELTKENEDLKRNLQNSDEIVISLRNQYKSKENELRNILDSTQEKHKSELTTREIEMKENSKKLKEELDKSMQQMMIDNEKYKAENIALRGELQKVKEIYDDKFKSISLDNSDKEAIISALRRQLQDKENEVSQLKENTVMTNRSKAAILDELHQNNEQISSIKKEYKDEIERLSSICKTLNFNNEKLQEKLSETFTKLEKSEDVINEYKKVVENLTKTKENKMQELMDAESENEKLKKILDVYF